MTSFLDALIAQTSENGGAVGPDSRPLPTPPTSRALRDLGVGVTSSGALRALGVGVTALPIGPLSMAMPPLDKGPGGLRNYVPGIVPQAYSFADGLSQFGGMVLNGVDRASQAILPSLSPSPLDGPLTLPHLPGAETAQKMVEDSTAETSSIVPHIAPDPNSPIQQAISKGVIAGGQAFTPMFGSAKLVAEAPALLRSLIRFTVPGFESKAVAPVVGGLTGVIEGGTYTPPVQAQEQEPPQSTVADPLGIHADPMPDTTQPPVPLQPFSVVAKTPDPTDPLGLRADAPMAPPPYTGIDYQSPGMMLMYGLGAIAAVKAGPRVLKMVDELAGGVRAKWYAEKATAFNDHLAEKGSGAFNLPNVNAPLPVGTRSPAVAVNQAVRDSTATLNAYTDIVAKHPSAAALMRADTGNTFNAAAFNTQVAEIAASGIDHASGTVMPSITQHFRRIAKLAPEQTKAYNEARYAANELDNRNNALEEAMSAANKAGEAFDPRKVRVNFYNTSDEELRAAVAKARLDPAVARELDAINLIHRRLATVLESSGLVDITGKLRLMRTHPNYLQSTNLDGTTTGLFGERGVATASGLDNIPVHASEVDKQHFTELFKSVADNRWRRKFVDMSYDYQQRTPGAAKIFTPHREVTAEGLPGDWIHPEGKGDTVSFVRNGVRETWKVGNAQLLADINGGGTRSGQAMQSLNYMRSILQSTVTGPMAAAVGHFYPPLNALRNATQLSAFRPEGMSFGPVSSLIQKATSGRVNPRGLLPDIVLGATMGLAQGAGAQMAHFFASTLGPDASNTVTKLLDSTVGPQVRALYAARMKNAWNTSIRAAMKADGTLGSSGKHSAELPSKQFGAQKMISSPLNNQVPELFRSRGVLGGVTPTVVHLRNLYHEFASVVNDSAHTHFYSTNKGKMPDAVLAHNVRNATGDPGVHPGNRIVRNIADAVPYGNISIQGIARILQSFNETPFSSAYGAISTFGSLALLQVYTAMMAGPEAVNHMKSELSNDQQAARAMFYLSGRAPEESPYYNMAQEQRVIYPMFLSAAYNALNVDAHGETPTLADSTLNWLHSFFGKHTTPDITGSSLGEQTLAGASAALSAGLPPAADAFAKALGVNANPTLYNQLTPGGSGFIPMGSNRHLPGQAANTDGLTGSIVGDRISAVVSAMFGITASSIIQAATTLKANKRAGGDLLHGLGIVGDQAVDRLQNSIPASQAVWKNNDQLSSRTPLIEHVEQAMQKLRPLASFKSDAKLGATDDSNGFTRSKGQELDTAPLNDNVIPKDPMMQQLYYSYGSYAGFINRKMMPEISDLRKQIKALEGSPLPPNDIREKRNAYTREIQKKYEAVAGIIRDADTAATNLLGKPVSILGVDFTKGPEQFNDQ